MIFQRGEGEYLGKRGVPWGGGTSMIKTSLKGLGIVPKVQNNSLLMIAWSTLCW